MKIQYLGTGAAEGIPALFCECDVCKMSRKIGGRSIRTRSQALIDDRLLIDFPPDTYFHFIKYNIPMSKIKNCIVTHSHPDHLYTSDIKLRKKGYAHVDRKQPPLKFYSAEAGYKNILSAKESGKISDEEITVDRITPFETYKIDGYEITPLPANHSVYTSPVIYLIEKEGKSILYSHDTAEFPDETAEFLKKYKKPLGLVSLDCTHANTFLKKNGHLNLRECASIKKDFIKWGTADDNTVFVLNHFSHNGKDVFYDDFVRIASEDGFEVSYDGLTICI